MENSKATVGTPGPQTEIPALLAELANAVRLAHDSMDTITDRLAPVLRNEPSDSQPTQEIVALTGLGQNLAVSLMLVQGLNSRLADARNRLEL